MYNVSFVSHLKLSINISIYLLISPSIYLSDSLSLMPYSFESLPWVREREAVATAGVSLLPQSTTPPQQVPSSTHLPGSSPSINFLTFPPLDADRRPLTTFPVSFIYFSSLPPYHCASHDRTTSRYLA